MEDFTNEMRALAIATTFVLQPETLPVFMAWVEKGHEVMHGAPCIDDKCVMHRGRESSMLALLYRARELLGITTYFTS